MFFFPSIICLVILKQTNKQKSLSASLYDLHYPFGNESNKLLAKSFCSHFALAIIQCPVSHFCYFLVQIALDHYLSLLCAEFRAHQWHYPLLFSLTKMTDPVYLKLLLDISESLFIFCWALLHLFCYEVSIIKTRLCCSPLCSTCISPGAIALQSTKVAYGVRYYSIQDSQSALEWSGLYTIFQVQRGNFLCFQVHLYLRGL